MRSTVTSRPSISTATLKFFEELGPLECPSATSHQGRGFLMGLREPAPRIGQLSPNRTELLAALVGFCGELLELRLAFAE